MAGKPFPEDMKAPDRKPVKVRSAPTKSEIPLEHEEQKNFVKWFRQQYPGVLIFAPPMAAVRSNNQAAWLTAEGMVKGIPDLHIPEWKTVIEMKRIKGSTISKEQYWMEAHYKRIGWTHFFAYGFEDARQKILTVSNP
jgi:hypothetical protein